MWQLQIVCVFINIKNIILDILQTWNLQFSSVLNLRMWIKQNHSLYDKSVKVLVAIFSHHMYGKIGPFLQDTYIYEKEIKAVIWQYEIWKYKYEYMKWWIYEDRLRKVTHKVILPFPCCLAVYAKISTGRKTTVLWNCLSPR